MAKSKWTRRHFLGATGLATLTDARLLTVHAEVNAQYRFRAASIQDEVINSEVLVCGGGPSGFAAAVMAARGGAKVLLLERYGRLGGMAVHARVAPLMGRSDSPFVREILGRIGGPRLDPDRLDLQYADMIQEAGADLRLHSWAFQTLLEAGRVTGVRLVTKQGTMQARAKVIVDATGDGDVAFGAGAAFEKGRSDDGLMQPMSIMFTVAGLEEATALYCGGEREARKIHVGGRSWEAIVNKGRRDKELPEHVGVVRTYRTSRPGEAVVNATQINYVDGTKVKDLTKAELEGRRQAFRIIDFLKKHAPGYTRAYISGMPAVIGVRETRRFLGVKYLKRADLLAGRRCEDAVVRNASFVIDIHNPNGAGQVEDLARRVKPYDIPYGCLVPEKIDGLLLAGRCISGSHDAHASYRVQQIAMAIGAAAGAAAAEAVKSRVIPRSVNIGRVQAFLWS